MESVLRKKIEELLNAHNREDVSNTPDFILARYMLSCLEAFDSAVNERDEWYGKKNAQAHGADKS